jgi:hypothetical protein
MTPTQERIREKLVSHGFEELPSIGTSYKGYRKGCNYAEVNINVGPRGKVFCWAIVNETSRSGPGTLVSVEMPLVIL